MRLATWNVNSIRTRVGRVVDFLERSGTDVLALQETKCRDDQFPEEAFHAAGYDVVHHGLSQWNGVAVVSRLPVSDVEVGFPGMPTWGEPAAAEARALGATVDGVRVWSLYVPNGRELDNPHYQYKLDWLAGLRTAAEGWLAADADAPIALVGDWNIAPRDEDVWDIAAFAGATHVSPAEREALAALTEAGFSDVTREHTPGAYTYWDYQRLRFPRNEGMRIDLVLGSPALAARVSGAHIDRDERKGKGASDHVPVVVDLG
ncbi:exodeoxyribonuclease III [Georgenia sp. H159]|uniref:exodeoxyribonuclease III n=1 Tax=Georgenia sp. H159 TaxID=3076115 RepID=UPI002D78899F|nr:exodeoxyribonuclease III [Georgenia sp. H159]